MGGKIRIFIWKAVEQYLHTPEHIAPHPQNNHTASSLNSSHPDLLRVTMLQPRFGGTTLRCVASRKGVSGGFNIFEVRMGSTTAVPRGKTETTQIPTQTLAQHPLSAMPTGMLLRSLFVATVSSNKFLLLPSLHLLSFFSKPNRSYLFNVDRNPVLKAILKRTLYNQFCAGETERETKMCVKQLKDLGFKGVILTYAKEMVFDHKSKSANLHASETTQEKAAPVHDTDIDAWRVGTLKTVDLISEGDILALKYVCTIPGKKHDTNGFQDNWRWPSSYRCLL